MKQAMTPYTTTLCPSPAARYAQVTSPVDKFAEIVSLVPNYASPAYK